MPRRTLSTLVLLVLVFGLAAGREPRFLEPTSLNAILLTIPILLVLGLAQMLVMVTRGIDVSVGSMTGVVAMVVAMTFRDFPSLPLPLVLCVGLITGLALGAVNGFLVAGAKVPPIVATLGTLSAYRGLVFILSRGIQVDSNEIPDAVSRWSIDGPVRAGAIAPPWLFVMALALAVVAAWFVRRVPLGRDVFAVGNNPDAAHLRGVNVRQTLFAVYALAGLAAGFAGVFYVSRFGFVNPGSAGRDFELVVIASAVIGGTKVTGGSGSALGVVLGATLLAGLANALAVLGIDATWQQLVYGLVILVAIVIDQAILRWEAPRAA